MLFPARKSAQDGHPMIFAYPPQYQFILLQPTYHSPWASQQAVVHDSL